jgi:hypothetical protein
METMKLAVRMLQIWAFLAMTSIVASAQGIIAPQEITTGTGSSFGMTGWAPASSYAGPVALPPMPIERDPISVGTGLGPDVANEQGPGGGLFDGSPEFPHSPGAETFATTATPEPSSLVLIVTTFAGAAAIRFRHRNRKA